MKWSKLTDAQRAEAREQGVGWKSFSMRIARGWSVTEAIYVPIRRREMTQAERAADLDPTGTSGVPAHILVSRIYSGWSRERALTTPYRPRLRVTREHMRRVRWLQLLIAAALLERRDHELRRLRREAAELQRVA